MVGYTYNSPFIKVQEKEEEQRGEEEKKSNDFVLDYSNLEGEDFSEAFLDSVLDFSDWVEIEPDPFMAEVKAEDLVQFDLESAEILEKSGGVGEGDVKEEGLVHFDLENAEILEKSAGVGEGDVKEEGLVQFDLENVEILDKSGGVGEGDVKEEGLVQFDLENAEILEKSGGVGEVDVKAEDLVQFDLESAEILQKSGGVGEGDVKPEGVVQFDQGNAEILEKSVGVGGGKDVLFNASFSSVDGLVKVENVGDLIEEEMSKVSLGGGREDVKGIVEVAVVGDGGVGSGEVVCADGNEVKNSDEVVLEHKADDAMSNREESDDDSDSSSSSSTSEEEDEEDGEKSGETKEGAVEMEEGEIRDIDADDMVAWSDDEDDVAGGSCSTGPIKSKNELQVLPPVPPVNATIQPHHQTLPVGVVLSILGAQVIVEGVEKHNPLSEGSILWITESRTPLGIIDEIFGPVKNPYYVVRYNSESEVPAGICQGSSISFVPEFADYVLNDNNLYKKGYDASGENDEELSDEVEFSDDEKEAEYKKMLKMSKRRENEQGGIMNMKKDKKSKNRGGNWKNEHQPFLTSQSPANTSRSMDSVQGLAVGSGAGPAFQPVAQAPPNLTAHGPSSGVWPNMIPGMPPQPVNMGMGFPAGFPANIPWMQQPFSQQPPFQLPLPNAALFPQFDPTQIFPFGQPNLFGGPAFPSWPPNMGQNGPSQLQVGSPFQGLFSAPSSNVLPQGFGPNEVPMEKNTGMRAPQNLVGEASPNPNQGNGYPGRGPRKPFHRGGGHFRGGRGGRGGQQTR